MKHLYHSLRSEIAEWHRHFIFMLPGKVGFALRRRYAFRHFGSCSRDHELRIGEHVRIVNPQKLRVGKGVRISDHTVISAGEQ